MPKSLSFSDIAIRQGKNKCKSRLDADIKSEVARGLELNIPLIAANMSAVTNAHMCIRLHQAGALGVLHRAWRTDEEYVAEVKKISKHCHLVAASVGVGPTQVVLANTLREAGANIIVIDIAQGYSDAVIETGRSIRKLPFGKGLWIIVGNTINPEMMYEVDDFASAVKVGIAQGSVCETRNTAGCTEKQFTAVQAFKDVSRKLGLPIISDGSIKEPGDFTKALAAGANSVMAGGIFARCPESAADEVEVAGEIKKLYFGMASREAQRRWRGGVKEGTCPEGKTSLLDMGESVDALLERYSGALRSGITYAGATDIRSFQDLAKFVRV
jgi:IMP dehydrogenase/GMP reductase